MPTLTRHQKPTLKLSLAMKISLAVVILLLLLLFKDVLYRLDQQEDAKEQQTVSILHGSQISASAPTQTLDDNAAAQTQTPPTSPAPAQTSTLTPPVLGKLKITSTPTGYLNVRSAPSAIGQILTQVSPGSIFNFVALQNSWYQIVLPSGQIGWVSSQYISTNLATASPAPVIRHGDNDATDDN